MNIIFRNENSIFELLNNADFQATVLLNEETFFSVWRWDDKAFPLSLIFFFWPFSKGKGASL